MLVKATVIVLLVMMTFVIIASVFFRYVLFQPIYWAEELSRYCMVWMAMLGSALVFIENGHVGVTAVLDRLPAKVGDIVRRLGNLVVAAFLLIVFYTSIPFLISTEGQTTSALQLPMFVPYLAITVGTLLMGIIALQHALGRHRMEPGQNLSVCDFDEGKTE